MREIVKMTLVERESPTKIKDIWNTYHAPRPENVSTVLSAHQYRLLSSRLLASPFFIFPIRRKGGHFLLLLQSQEKSQLFTFLDDYKKAPERATPYFILTLFDEIIVKKGTF
jgi:ATP synthase F1 complex assembly factor 1